MSLFDLISEEDKDLMERYIDNSVPNGRTASLEYIMRYWTREKQGLYELFGNNIILEKNINTSVPRNLIEYKVQRLVNNERQFVKKLEDIFYDNGIFDDIADSIFRIQGLVDNKYLGNFNNVKEIELSNDNNEIQTFKLTYGAKPVRILGRICRHLGLTEDFERFRLAHSMIFNVKDFKGTLCLSIHPLDFMTMSDNESRWESCMSWRNEGCYRQGTIEMMNSPCVVIAYLKNEEDMSLCGGYTWNNKRWRELFIVNEKCITNIKSYPYTSEVLTKEVLSWLVDLARTNKGLTYDQPFEWQSEDGYPYFNMKYINFETSYMYNDITADSTRIHYMYVAPGVTDIDINYSGDFVCMECGECNEPSEYDGSTGTLICYKCEPSYYCYECGDRYYEDGLHYVDGNYYCEYCYDRLHTDALTELVIGSSHDVEITIIPKNRDDNRWKTFHLHQDTLENNELLRKSFKAIYKGYYKVESRYGGEYVQGTGLFVLEEDIEEEVLDYILDYASSYYPCEFNILSNWDINNTRVLELNNILNHYCLVDDIVKKEGVSVTLKFCP